VPRNRAITSPSPTQLDAWLTQFEDALQQLRPHMSHKLVTVVGRSEYATGRDPKEAAAAYHARQRGTEPAPPQKRKR
jgi:hypothetical protein